MGQTKKKSKKDVDETTSLTAKLEAQKLAAKAKAEKGSNKGGKADPKGKAGGAKSAKAAPMAKPRKGKKGYADVIEVMEEVADVEIDERQKEIEAKKALRMGKGQEALVDRKDQTKAEKKRADKIERQLNEKFDELLHEEAVITSSAGTAPIEEDRDDENIAAERDCLKIEQFTLSFKGNVLFKDTGVTLATGHRYGLVGPNGCGKSTFLRNLAAKKLPGMDPNFDLLHVEQEVDGTDETAINSVLSADKLRTRLLEEKEEIENSNSETDTEEEAAAKRARLEVVYNELRAIDYESAPARAAKILFGLQFTTEMQQQATKEIFRRLENAYCFGSCFILSTIFIIT